MSAKIEDIPLDHELKEDLPVNSDGEDSVWFFQGVALYPMTFGRKITAQCLDAGIYKSENFEEGSEEGKVRFRYAGLFQDMALVLFICTLTRAEHMALRKDEISSRAKAEMWLESLGVDAGNEKFQPFSEAFAIVTGGTLGK